MKIHQHFESPTFTDYDKIKNLPHLGTPGTWNWYGINLPDFGLTEALGGSLGNPQPSRFNNPAISTIGANTPQGSYFSPPTGQIKAASTTTPPSQTPPPGDGNNPPPSSPPPQSTNTGRDPHINPATGVWDDNYYASQQRGGGGGGSVDPYAQVRSDINSGYDAYLGSLDQMLNQGLPSQRSAQEGVARANFGTNQADLSGQLTQGLNTLGGQRDITIANQARNLKDLAANMRNSFLAGNIYLGSQGAGDSSAANQYSYALTQLGNKQQGDITSNTATIMDQIAARETNLQTIYNTETNKLKSGLDAQIAQIGSWFADAQNQLRQAQASGQLSKSQDLQYLSKTMLSQALNALNSAQQQAQQRSAALDQWAMNNSKDIKGLKANLASVAQFNPSLPTAQPITGTPSIGAGGAMTTPIGYGQTNQKIIGYDIFGRPIYAQ